MLVFNLPVMFKLNCRYCLRSDHVYVLLSRIFFTLLLLLFFFITCINITSSGACISFWIFFFSELIHKIRIEAFFPTPEVKHVSQDMTYKKRKQL